MKKVLLCYHSSQFGGVEKHILDIIEGLSKHFEISVVCPNGPLVEEYLKAGAKTHYDLSPKFEADFFYSHKIKKIILDEKIDIVHAHELLSGSLAIFGAWLARSQCTKRIYHVHTSFTQWKYSSIKKYFAPFINGIDNYAIANYFATDVIALTESVKKIRIENEHVDASKIRVIPNGIHLDQFKFDENGRKELRARYGIPDDKFVIGNIARFTEEKGHGVLVDAFKQLDNDKYLLVLAGGGKMLNDIQLKVQEYKLQDKVRFLGHFEESEKNKILSSFDCFVFPSFAEGFGIALVEAMSVGIPVIASDLPVLKDVGSDSISYFKTGDAINLKDKILNVTDINIEKEREQAKNFSMEKFWQAYTNLYNS
jgi:glycosyltransferase involved in cell wall biosynthesis